MYIYKWIRGGLWYIACSIYYFFLIISPSTIMAAIKVHGNPLSTATMRVLATLYEKELDHEFVIVDLRAGEHKKEHFLSRNIRKLKAFMYLNFFRIK